MDLLVVVDPADRSASRLLASLDSAADLRVTANPREAEHAARVARFDGLVFDPAFVGSDFLSRIRRNHPGQALIAWSTSSADVADLLDAGADEVLHSAMSGRELAARIAAARRRAARSAAPALDLGPLTVDATHGEARWDGRDLALTRREREVLQVLAESAGQTVPREVLYRRVWGYAMARGDRSVDVNVKRVRRKLAAARARVEIKTQVGVGYRLDVPARTDADAKPSVVTEL